jgi:hypothetical protein
MPDDKSPKTFEERLDAFRKQIAFHRGELSRLHNEYYAAIREAKAQTHAPLPLARTSRGLHSSSASLRAGRHI